MSGDFCALCSERSVDYERSVRRDQWTTKEVFGEISGLRKKCSERSVDYERSVRRDQWTTKEVFGEISGLLLALVIHLLILMNTNQINEYKSMHLILFLFQWKVSVTLLSVLVIHLMDPALTQMILVRAPPFLVILNMVTLSTYFPVTLHREDVMLLCMLHMVQQIPSASVKLRSMLKIVSIKFTLQQKKRWWHCYCIKSNITKCILSLSLYPISVHDIITIELQPMD